LLELFSVFWKLHTGDTNPVKILTLQILLINTTRMFIRKSISRFNPFFAKHYAIKRQL